MNTFLVSQTIKRYFAIALIFVALTFALGPVNTSAQTRRYRRNRVYVGQRHRSFWKKHRDKLTVAGTTLGGAAIGGLAGGKKGAAIGSLAGAGSGALYTYKIRKRRHRRY